MDLKVAGDGRLKHGGQILKVPKVEREPLRHRHARSEVEEVCRWEHVDV